MLPYYCQILFAALVVVYPMVIVFLAKSAYKMMKQRGFEDMVAVYYNRKKVVVVHRAIH